MNEVLTATCAYEADSHHESAWDKAGLRRLAAAASDPLRPRLAAIPPKPYILPSLPFERNIKSYLKTGNGLSSFGIAPSRTHRSVWPICRPSFPSKRFTRARMSREALFGGNDCSRRATRTQSTRRNTLTRPVPGLQRPVRSRAHSVEQPPDRPRQTLPLPRARPSQGPLRLSAPTAEARAVRPGASSGPAKNARAAPQTTRMRGY